MRPSLVRFLVAPVIALTLGACSDTADPFGDIGSNPSDVDCSLDLSLVGDGGQPRDGIPALTNPEMVPAESAFLDYLRDDSRVLGVVVEGEARAYPLNILWWHEIVNDEVGDTPFSVTYCPLTGSGLVFDRTSLGSEVELGVSGLLFANNLIMFDRNSDDLYGPQMSVAGRCDGFKGLQPDLMPVVETSWARWKELHPETEVVSQRTGHDFDYRIYPYPGYDELNSEELFIRVDLDPRRPPKELVLGIKVGEDGGKGYPYGLLDEAGFRTVVNDRVGGEDVVILYTAPGGGTAAAFERTVDGQTLTFEVFGERFRDVETGSIWDPLGRAVEGPLEGERLSGVEEAYVSFWFAWAFFQPTAELFTG